MKNKRYLRCSSSVKLGCRARAVLDLSNNNTTLYHSHNHPAALDETIVDIFLKELKLACWERTEDHPKVIYEQVALLNPDAAKLKPFQSVRCSLQRWRTMEYVTSLDAVNLKMMRRKPNMPRYIVDGFVFHVNIMKGNPPMIYLRCLEYKRLGCHARAIIPYDGSIQDIKVNKAHNHPPDFAAEEKIVFMRELKEVMLKHPSVPSRTVYSTLSEMYPNAARETPFDSIRHKMSRWRRIKDE